MRNHVTKIHMFAGDLCDSNARIIERGAKKGTKYFMIPLNLKSKKKKNYRSVSYNKVETEDQVFFVFIADKDVLLE